jgi:hypothetical protein
VIGPYVFQLSGSTTISGVPQPTVSLGRIVFDGSGKISGTASATFSGLLLGNPVTGAYVANTDCTLVWRLQDDSGAYQHFSGKMSPDAQRVQFRQTDPGGVRGTMMKTGDACSSADLRDKYQFTVTGSTKAMQPGEAAHSVLARGTVEMLRNKSFQVDSDCSVRFNLTLPAANGETTEPPPINLRGFLVNGGKEVLAFQTDPGAMVAARLTVLPE